MVVPITRNIKGIKKAALIKQLNAVTRAGKAIEEMLVTNQIITFEAVASFAKVSRTFLYKNPELRKQIEQHREQHGSKIDKKILRSKNKEDITNLIQRLKLLENENKELKKTLELLYGELHLKQITNLNKDF